MDGEQGGYPNSSQSHRSRGRGCSKKPARGLKVEKVPDTVFVSTEVSEPTSFDTTGVDGSDADASDPHSGPVSDAESSNPHSVAGDSVVDTDTDMEERAERKRAHAQPKVPFHGDDRSRGESSRFNNEPEVGNIGIFFGNRGLDLLTPVAYLRLQENDLTADPKSKSFEWAFPPECAVREMATLKRAGFCIFESAQRRCSQD